MIHFYKRQSIKVSSARPAMASRDPKDPNYQPRQVVLGPWYDEEEFQLVRGALDQAQTTIQQQETTIQQQQTTIADHHRTAMHSKLHIHVLSYHHTDTTSLCCHKDFVYRWLSQRTHHRVGAPQSRSRLTPLLCMKNFSQS